MKFAFEPPKAAVRGLCEWCKKGEMVFLGRVYRCLYCDCQVPSMLSSAPLQKRIAAAGRNESDSKRLNEKDDLKPVQLDLFPGQYFV